MSLARQRISQHEPPAGTHLFLGTDSRSSPGAAGRARGERGRRGHWARVGPRTARRCPGRRGNFLASFVPRKARGSGAELRAPHARKVTERRGARQAPFAALPALSSTWSANRERSRSQTRSSKRRGGGTGGSKGARNGRARGRSPRAERLQPSAPSPLLSSRQSSGAPDPALPAASSVPPPEREVNRSALEGAPLRKLTFDLPGFALLPAGHAAGGRSCLAPGTERSGEGRLRAVTDQQTALIEGPRPPRNDEWDRGGAGRGEERVWRREEERGERERGGESGRESGGKEGGGEGAREGGRERRKEGGREGGRGEPAPRSLSPSLARSLPLPRRLRSPRRAPLRLTGGGRWRRGRGRGRGFPGRGGAEWGGLSVSPDGQRLLPETGPRAVRLTPPGAGGFGCPGAVEAVGCNFPERERRKKLRHSRAALTGRPQSRVLRASQRCPSEGQMLPPALIPRAGAVEAECARRVRGGAGRAEFCAIPRLCHRARVPPPPRRCRQRWAERYGRAGRAAPQPRARGRRQRTARGTYSGVPRWEVSSVTCPLTAGVCCGASWRWALGTW